MEQSVKWFPPGIRPSGQAAVMLSLLTVLMWISGPTGPVSASGPSGLAEGKEITVSVPSETIFVMEGDGSVAVPITFLQTGTTDPFGGAIIVYEAYGSGANPATTPEDWEYDDFYFDSDGEIYETGPFTSATPAYTRNINISIVDDQEREGDEMFLVGLANPYPGNPTRDKDLQFILEPRTVTVIILDNDPPAKTVGFTAIRGEEGVALRWDDPGDASVIGYQYTADWGTTWIDIPYSGPAEANATSYTVTGLSTDTDYEFAVRAVNSAGDSGFGPASDGVTFVSASANDPVSDPTLAPTGVPTTGTTAAPSTPKGPIQYPAAPFNSNSRSLTDRIPLGTTVRNWLERVPVWQAAALSIGAVVIAGGVLKLGLPLIGGRGTTKKKRR